MVQLTNSDGDISEIEPTYISIVDEDDEVVVLFKGAHNVKFNFNDLGFINQMNNEYGIILDDILAGIYSIIILYILYEYILF